MINVHGFLLWEAHQRPSHLYSRTAITHTCLWDNCWNFPPSLVNLRNYNSNHTSKSHLKKHIKERKPVSQNHRLFTQQEANSNSELRQLARPLLIIAGGDNADADFQQKTQRGFI